MKIVKIVHTADLHLGSHFSSTPEIAVKRKTEQLENLKKIIDICREREAVALLIAGDLFDTLRVDIQLLAEVQSILGDSGIYVYIAPGNHDPATPDSSYCSFDGWPENVHIFKGGPECVEIPDTGAYIWGLGFEHSLEPECLLGELTPVDNAVNILLMHADIVAEGAESRYNPITVEQLSTLGMDYIALGHIHKPSSFAIGERLCCNSGCPSGRGFDEQGDHGVFSGYVDRGFAHMEYVSTGCRQYLSEKVDVSGCDSSASFCAAIKTALEKSVGEGYKENIYDLTLIGALAKGIMPDIPSVSKQLMDELHYVRLTDITTTELDLETLMKDTSLKGAFVRVLVGRMEQDEKNRDKYLRALLYGLRAFDGEVRINEDY